MAMVLTQLDRELLAEFDKLTDEEQRVMIAVAQAIKRHGGFSKEEQAKVEELIKSCKQEHDFTEIFDYLATL